MGQSWRVQTYLPVPSLHEATKRRRRVTVTAELNTSVRDLKDREITPSSTTNHWEKDDFCGCCSAL
jgi:hypothetical protein